jgi:hypothetical protein
VTIITNLREDGTATITRTVPLSYVLESCLPSKGLWADAFYAVERELSFQALRFARYVQKYGFPATHSPITIGADKRLIDGHLRVYVASLLGIEELEVQQWIARSL